MSPNIQYITNSQGERRAVVIGIKEFEEMLAEIDLALEEFERESSGPLRTLLENLRAAGKIEL